MKKTLIITLEYPPQIGGIASYVYNQARTLGEVTVVYAPIYKNKDYKDGEGFKVYRKKPYFWLWPRWFRMFFQIRKIVKQEKIEQIYVHHILPVGYIAWLIKKIKKIPYTVFFHGTDVELSHRNFVKKIQTRWVCGQAEALAFNSEFLKNKFLKIQEKLSDKKIIILYPSPGEIFLAKQNKEEIEKLRRHLALDGKRVMLTVARFADGKGYPHLLRLLPQIIEKVPNLVWLIIGDGPKKEEIVKGVQTKSLQNVVRFLNLIPYKDLPKYYSLADLFVLLTHPDEQTEEGWGTVFAEAAALGIPAVAGRAGGVEEVVDNLKTGLVVDAYQDMSVVSAIVDLLKEDKYREQMGKMAKNKILTELNWQTQIKKLYE